MSTKRPEEPESISPIAIICYEYENDYIFEIQTPDENNKPTTRWKCHDLDEVRQWIAEYLSPYDDPRDYDGSRDN